jgi:hypothetical protein
MKVRMACRVSGGNSFHRVVIVSSSTERAKNLVFTLDVPSKMVPTFIQESGFCFIPFRTASAATLCAKQPQTRRNSGQTQAFRPRRRNHLRIARVEKYLNDGIQQRHIKGNGRVQQRLHSGKFSISGQKCGRSLFVVTSAAIAKVLLVRCAWRPCLTLLSAQTRSSTFKHVTSVN